MPNKVERINKHLNDALAAAAGFIFIGIAFFTFADIIGRYLFKSPIIGAIEIVQLALPWAASFSFAYGLIKGIHPGVTLISTKLPQVAQRWLTVCLYLLSFLLFAALAYGAWRHFWSSWQVREIMQAALMNLPLWASKLALPIGMFLMATTYLILCLQAVRRKEDR